MDARRGEPIAGAAYAELERLHGEDAPWRAFQITRTRQDFERLLTEGRKTKATRTHAEMLRSYAYRLSGHDSEIADQVTKSAIVKALDKWERYTPERPFQPWFFRIGQRILWDILEVRKQEGNSLDQLADGQRPGRRWASSATVETVADIDNKQVLDALLATLPLQQAEAVVLHHIQDFTYADAAELLGIPVGTFGTRVKQGMDKLEVAAKEYALWQRQASLVASGDA